VAKRTHGRVFPPPSHAPMPNYAKSRQVHKLQRAVSNGAFENTMPASSHAIYSSVNPPDLCMRCARVRSRYAVLPLCGSTYPPSSPQRVATRPRRAQRRAPVGTTKDKGVRAAANGEPQHPRYAIIRFFGRERERERGVREEGQCWWFSMGAYVIARLFARRPYRWTPPLQNI